MNNLIKIIKKIDNDVLSATEKYTAQSIYIFLNLLNKYDDIEQVKGALENYLIESDLYFGKIDE